MVQLSSAVGLKVVAEGVERPSQLDALAGTGRTHGRGHLLGPPGPAGALGLGRTLPAWSAAAG